MFIRARPCAQARMPSMRQPGLNPRLPSTPARRETARGAPAPTTAPRVSPAHTGAVSVPGGFHESSYELQHGMQITESAWPDDVTVPGRLGEH